METAYLICAVVGVTLVACQFLLTLFGLGGDHNFGGHDVAGHDGAGHDGAGGHDATWFFGVLTFRTLSTALAFFGLTGLIGIQSELEGSTTLLVALASGVGAMFVVGWLMRFLAGLNVDGTLRIEKALGSRGTVYLTVPEGNSGMGKVHVGVLDRTMEYNAVTPNQTLPTGAKIIVIGVINSDTVEVALATD